MPRLEFPKKEEAKKNSGKPQFKPPLIRAGDIVQWHPSGVLNDQDPFPAFVNHVGAFTLSVSVISKDSTSLNPRDGVLHCDDPRLANSNARDNGCWSYTPQHEELLELKEALANAIETLKEMVSRAQPLK